VTIEFTKQARVISPSMSDVFMFYLTNVPMGIVGAPNIISIAPMPWVLLVSSLLHIPFEWLMVNMSLMGVQFCLKWEEYYGAKLNCGKTYYVS
jgi:hypothetical protein